MAGDLLREMAAVALGQPRCEGRLPVGVSLAALMLVGVLVPHQAHASGGASAVELGTARSGVASAGQAASANDASPGCDG